MVGLDGVVRVLLQDVPCGWGEFVDDARVDRCPVGGDLTGASPCVKVRVKNARAAEPSRRSETRTSMTWPCWSTAR